MQIHKAFKTRLYPDTKQRVQLARHFGAARWVYNHFLQYKTDQYKETGKSAPYTKLSRELTVLKSKPEYAWLGAVSRQCVCNSLLNLDVSFNNFFNKKSKYPRFKKKRGRQSFRVSAPFCQVLDDGVHLPLIGKIKCELKVPKEYKLYSITVSKAPTGKYFASINYECAIQDPVIDETKPVIGVDFGIKTFITASDGRKIEHPKPFADGLRRLKRLSRILSRRKVGSNRRNKTRFRVALQHEKIANIRADFLHKLSRKMIAENQGIYIEDLNLEGMKRRYGMYIGDLGWAEFTRQLLYKGVWYGCDIFKIDRFFPSSKTCSVCNKINKNLQLSQRQWVCGCGAAHDRDVNAAINILTYGRADRNLRSQRGEVHSLVEARSQE